MNIKRRLKIVVDEIIEINELLHSLLSDYSFFMVEGSIKKLRMDNKEYQMLSNFKVFVENFLNKTEEKLEIINEIENYTEILNVFYDSIEFRIRHKKFDIDLLAETVLKLEPSYRRILELYNESDA